MRIDAVPALYLPEVETTIRDLVRRIRLDMQLRAQAPEPTLVPDRMMDATHGGTLLIAVAETPQDDNVRLFETLNTGGFLLTAGAMP